MDLIESYKRGMSLYATFDGRWRRRDFWLFVLSVFLLTLAVGIVENILLMGATGGALVALVNLVHLVPGLAAGARRLHDSDKSAWLLLLFLIPALGFIIMLVLYCLPGTAGSNRFGPDPKAV